MVFDAVGTFCEEKILCRKKMPFTPFWLFSPCAEDFSPCVDFCAGSHQVFPHPWEQLAVLQARLFLHLEWGLSCALRLQVEEQSLLVLRLRLLLWWLDLFPFPLLCPVRPAVSSMRKRSPAPAGVDVARPAVGPAVRVRNVLGIAPLPLVARLTAGRSPIGLLLLKMTEWSLLLPLLDVCLEVLLAILAPLRRATAGLVLALRAGGRGLPL